jgi:hypothetical protein
MEYKPKTKKKKKKKRLERVLKVHDFRGSFTN